MGVVGQYALLGLGIEKAKLLLSDPKSLCVRKEREEHMAISPAFIGTLKEGIKVQLNSRINKYSDELDGLLLAYEDIKLLSPDGATIDDRPFIHFQVRVSYLVFQPRVDDILAGVIKEIYSSYVICVVHELFNTTVFKSGDDSNWNVRDFKVGNMLQFRVEELSINTRMFSMKGKLVKYVNEQDRLLEEETGNEEIPEEQLVTEISEDETMENGQLAEKIVIETVDLVNGEDNVNSDCSPPAKKKKRKKKRNSRDYLK